VGKKYWRRLRPPSEPVKESTIAGILDGLVDGAWQGWALDMAMPGRTLAVTFVTATGRRIEVMADHYRADVHCVMPGHGHYGFRVPARLLEADGPAQILAEDTALPHLPSPELP
jgi:hypothetical protein